MKCAHLAFGVLAFWFGCVAWSCGGRCAPAASHRPAPGARDQDGVWPGKRWQRADPEALGVDIVWLDQVRRYALHGGGSGCVVFRGRLILEWGDLKRRYDLKSTTKSFGATAVGLALADGRIELDAPAARYHPRFGVPPESNRRTGWLGEITILHLLTHTAGFDKPGGYEPLLFRPGTRWHYSDGGPNWLAECLTLVYKRDLKEVMFERVFRPLGIEPSDLAWRDNQYRPRLIDGIPRREFGSGIHANVDAMARLGYLYLREGRWRDRQILPRWFVRAAAQPVPALRDVPTHNAAQYGQAARHYGLLWWNNADGTLAHVPHDAFWAWGLYDSLIVVIPSLDVVLARAGRSLPRRQGAAHYEVLQPLLEALVAAVRPAFCGPERSPYPASRIVHRVRWAPRTLIFRAACGSDNWPITWAADDRLYTAFGDGRGFQPYRERKLSLGLAVIEGGPERPRGHNLVARHLEATGDGASGPKASGLLAVGDRLYILVRNRSNAQLAWSDDQGQSWSWATWRFRTSFGCPTFLQFGRGYTGARDDYIYVYSPDTDSAYRRAHRVVLARVHRDRLTDQDAYEFFAGIRDGEPVWSRDVAERRGVLRWPQSCYRLSVSYCAGLRRYLLCMTGPGADPRFRGGLALFEAKEPWGPWRTLYYAPEWDVGPGESSCLPTKWMSPDGRIMYLVFSGNDCFSIRRLELEPAKH